jgi:hypothetical protein
MAPMPEAIILVLAPFVLLFSQRVWLHGQLRLLGAILAPGARTVTATLRVMVLVMERRFTHDHRVLKRATWGQPATPVGFSWGGVTRSLEAA